MAETVFDFWVFEALCRKTLENKAFFAIFDGGARLNVFYRCVGSALARSSCAVHIGHWRGRAVKPNLLFFAGFMQTSDGLFQRAKTAPVARRLMVLVLPQLLVAAWQGMSFQRSSRSPVVSCLRTAANSVCAVVAGHDSSSWRRAVLASRLIGTVHVFHCH